MDVESPDSDHRSSWQSELWPIVLICGIWGLLALLIDPKGEFPLNDDWAHALPVKALVETGSIRMTDWNCVSLIALMGWGALFCWPAGFSFTALRISTVVLGMVGLVGFYLLLRRFGASRALAAIGVFVLGANPCYLGLSYTFMTDIPFLTLTIVAVLLLVRGLDEGRDLDLWLGLGVGLLAVFVRQLALAIFLGFLVAYPFRRGLGRRWVLQALLPTVVAFVALKLFERAMIAIDQLPTSYYKFNDALSASLTALAHARLGVLKLPLSRSFELVMYLGLFQFPFLMILWPTFYGRLSGRGRVILLAWIATFTVPVTGVLLAINHLMPLLGNIVYNLGIGAQSLAGEWPVGLPRWIMVIVTTASALGGAIALASLFELVRSMWVARSEPAAISARWRLIFVAAVCIISFGPPAFAFSTLFDRYLLGLLPLAMLLVLEGMGRRSVRLQPLPTAAALALMAGVLVFSVGATHDYLAWNRIRWAAGDYLRKERGVGLDDLDGGWEFNNYFPNVDRLYASRAERESSKTLEERGIGGSISSPPGSRYRIAVSPSAEHETVRTFPVPAWLPSSPRALYAQIRTGPPPSAETSPRGRP
jgi:hypothetical protein